MADDQIPNDAPLCKNCRFWRTISEKYAQGECRKNPPVLVTLPGDVVWDWPVTGAFSWCGQHEPQA